MTLFLYEITITVFGVTMTIQSAEESAISFIHTLASTGGWVGSAFVVLFAIAIPLAKIVMLVLGELWRNSSSPRLVAHARRCIITVRLISKWACPDMFAYILMVFLIRSLSHPPTLGGVMHLDVGFTCYALFCVGSTVSSLGIAVPPAAKEASGEDNQSEEVESEPSQVLVEPSLLSCLGERLGPRGAVRLAALPWVAWAVLLGAGLYLPCMALRLDVDGLVANGTIPPMLLDLVVNELHLPDLAKADVSVWKSMCALAAWTGAGDLNTLIAFLMLAVFVVLFVAVDALAMMHTMLALHEHINGHVKYTGWLSPSRAMRFSRALKKLSMLDVLVAGVVVVVFSGSIYADKGLVLSLRWGLACLVGAEACRYAVFGLVSVAVASVPTAGADASKQVADSCGQKTDVELCETVVV